MTTCRDRLLLTRILLVRPGIRIVPQNLHTLLLIERGNFVLVFWAILRALLICSRAISI